VGDPTPGVKRREDLRQVVQFVSPSLPSPCSLLFSCLDAQTHFSVGCPLVLLCCVLAPSMLELLRAGGSHVTLSNTVLFFGWGGGGDNVQTQDFALAKQVLYCLSPTSSPFCSGYFGDGVS
jgi:hypothetical protein